MLKKIYILFALCISATLFIVACNATGPSTDPSSNPVHMNDTDFVQSSITIKKGERITLISDTFIAHTIANGTWKNGTPETVTEQGAPVIDHVSVAGNNSMVIGPFSMIGKFKLYCTIHQGMNLLVIVQ